MVVPVNTASAAKDTVEVAYDRASNRLHLPVFRCHPLGCEDAIDRERAELRFERQRLWYVAATRARDLFLVPRLSSKPDGRSWIRLVDFDLDGLEEFGVEFPPANIQVEDDAENRQDRETFAREAATIAAATPRVRRETPHLAEGIDPEEGTALVPDDLAPAELLPVRGSLGRGLILHKLLEEVLTGELADTRETLAARGAGLAVELGLVEEGRPDPEEMAEAVLRGLSLPEIGAVRGRLRAEWPISSTEMHDGEEVATLGVADAAAVEQDGSASLIVDWKSDVGPTEGALANYRGQLGQYLRASGAQEGLLVFLTSGAVHRINSLMRDGD